MNKGSVVVYRAIPNLYNFCMHFAVMPLTSTNHSKIQFKNKYILHVLKRTMNKRSTKKIYIYLQGGSIIRMMKFYLGDETFAKGLTVSKV